jgi:hypothetical protein
MTHLTFGRACVKSEVRIEKKREEKKKYILALNHYAAMYLY